MRVTLPSGEVIEQAHTSDVLVHAVDAQGRYIGLVPEGEGIKRVLHPPPITSARWDDANSRWVTTFSLDEHRARALVEVDAAAGAARLRFMTDVPGQAVVYVRKAEQAQRFAAAGFAGEPPPYIAREAAESGLTPQALAEQIIDTGSQWDDVLSPAIEAARMRAKRRVQTATTAEEINNVVRIAREALAAVGG
jgi:hypothetical protein